MSADASPAVRRLYFAILIAAVLFGAYLAG